MKTKKNQTKPLFRGVLMAGACLAILATGAWGMKMLTQAKPPSGAGASGKKGLTVATVPVQKKEVTVNVTGFGQAFPVREAKISPRVSGDVVEKNSALESGGQVQKGEPLFRIDSTDYEIEAQKAAIRVELEKNQLDQLRVSFERDRGRLSAMEKNTALAKAEFDRLSRLYTINRVGTLSGVETAEQNYNSLADSEKNLKKSLDLYPLQIAKAKSDLLNAQADLRSAWLNVKRCEVTAPFSGRVKDVGVETGAWVTAGSPALTLADDRVLEIQVSLSDRDAFEILGLEMDSQKDPGLDVRHLACRVQTVTGRVTSQVPARVHRVVAYDPDTRTLVLAARVCETDMVGAAIPLMDGMFCRLIFFGPTIRDAVKIPARALNPDHTVYVDRNHRLKTLAVTRVMARGDEVYVEGAFHPDDRIITSALNHPLENMVLTDAGQKAGALALAEGGMK